jgi:hypothetical protein
MIFQVPAVIQKIETMSDRTVRLRVDTTRELNADDLAKLFELDKQEGWMVFAPQDKEVTEQDIPDEKIDSKDAKSQAQRIRSVIFVNWKENTNQKEDFDTYYRRMTEKIINRLKEEL